MPYECPSDSRSELDRLMEQYGSSLLRMSALYLKDASLAQDAVQETFLKAYRHLQDYRGESSEKNVADGHLCQHVPGHAAQPVVSPQKPDFP